MRKTLILWAFLIFSLLIMGSESGIIVNIKGEIHLSGIDNPLKGTIISPGDTINSKPGSYAEFIMLNSAFLRIMPSTRLIVETDFTDDITAIALDRGMMFAETGENTFIIETPQGIIRTGSSVLSIALRDNASRIYCMEGELSAANSEGQASAGKGEVIELYQDRMPAKVLDVIPETDVLGDEHNIVEIEFEDESGNTRILEILID
ncbi:MAG: FecR family protein [bacterium]